MTKQIFRGIKQVSASVFNAETNKKGYLWFVRTPEVTDDGNIANDSYDIYFGKTQYGHFREGEIAALRAAIDQIIADLGFAPGEFTFGEDVKTVSGAFDAIALMLQGLTEATGANQSAITTLSEKLATYKIKDVATDEKVLTVAEGLLSSEIGLEYNGEMIQLTGKGGVVVDEIPVSDFIKDGMLANVEYVDGELIFTWNVEAGDADPETEGVQAKVTKIKITDVMSAYTSGTAITIDAENGNTISVNVADVEGQTNYLKVKDNALVVEGMNAESAVLSEKIVITEGSPLEAAARAAFPDGEIPSGISVDELFRKFFIKKIYPKTSKNSSTYTATISDVTAPLAIYSTTVSDGAIVEVGTPIEFAPVTAEKVAISTIDPVVSGFKYGYQDTLDGEVNEATSITTSWDVQVKENNVYQLTATVTKFAGEVPATVQDADAAECTLSDVTFVAGLGDNVYSVNEDAPAFVGSHEGIASRYVVSNMGTVEEAEKSVSVDAVAQKTVQPLDKSVKFTVKGVYPVYSNISDGAFVADANVRVALQEGAVFVFESTPNENGSAYNFMFDYPATHEVSSFKLKSIDGSWVDFASDYDAKSQVIKKSIQGVEYDYYRLTTAGGNGSNSYQITLNKALNK